MQNREIGVKYENIAKEYLIKKGLKYLEKNFFSRYGEIDLIFLEQKTMTLIFVEVKYRKDIKFGNSLEMVDRKKIEKIILTSKQYLSENSWDGNIRFDVIGIDGSPKIENIGINWIKNAFEV